MVGVGHAEDNEENEGASGTKDILVFFPVNVATPELIRLVVNVFIKGGEGTLSLVLVTGIISTLFWSDILTLLCGLEGEKLGEELLSTLSLVMLQDVE